MDDVPHDPDRPDVKFPRWLMWSLFAALAILIVGYGAIFLYAKVLDDAPDEFGTADRDTALQAAGESRDGGSEGGGSTGGTWTIGAGSEVGYRVEEILFGVDTTAVGRTDEVTGSATIDGSTLTAAEFTVDVASITSGEGKRDGQFAGRVMSTDEFPTATFTLTEPIDLGVEPVDGAETTATLTGELTLRGVTNEVTFDVDAKVERGNIGVIGSIPVTFADYSIANPSFGGIRTEDIGLVEFVLVLTR